jgi:hypothetical protein
MIGGLYNTTSLLVEPTRALGSFLRTANASTAPLSSQQADEAARPVGRVHEAEPMPERLPTGVVHFVPVVLHMLEEKAARALEADATRFARERGQSPSEDRSENADVAIGDPDASPRAERSEAGDAQAAERTDAAGRYAQAGEDADRSKNLDTLI